jgi:tetratricopeptide (TPR) repeat protein
MTLPLALQSAEVALQQGRYEEAIALCEQCIEAMPDLLSAYWYLGLAWILQGESEQAQSIWLAAMADCTLDEASQSMADLLQILNTEAERQFAQGHLHLTALLDQQSLDLDTDQVTVNQRLAYTLAQLGRLDEAIAQWQRVIELQPDCAIAYRALGQIWQRLGKSDAARAAYANAVALRPDWTEVKYQLGLCLIGTQQFEAAIACLEEVVQQQPQFSPAYGDLAYSWLHQGNWEMAIALLRQMVEVAPDFVDCYCHWVNQAENTNPLMHINAQFLAAISQPESTDCLYSLLGQLLCRSGEFEQAILAYQQAIQHHPHQGETYLELGKIFAQLNRWKEAIALYQTALEINPLTDPVYVELGKVWAKLGQIDSAIEAYCSALNLNPNSVDSCYQLGNLYLKIGQIDQAIYSYQKVLNLAPDSIEVHLQLAIAYAQNHHPLEAIASLQKVLNLNPNSAKVVWAVIQELIQQQHFNPNSFALNQIMPIDCPRSFYATTQAWAIAHQVETTHYLPIHPQETVGLTSPQTLEPEVHFSFRFGNIITLPESFIVTLPNGRFWTDPDQTTTAVITPEDDLLFDLSPESPILSPGHPDKTGDRHSLMTTTKIQSPQPIQGTVAVLSGLSDDMYFHWMCDVLPRLQLIQLAGLDLTTVDYFLVNHHLPFQQETLRLLGIPDAQILETKDHLHIQADQLIVPSFSGAVAWMSKTAFAWIRTVFIQQITQPSKQSFRKLYISRKQASTRRIINEEDVIVLLQSLGFEIVTLENQSILEQVQLMMEADVIIAPHGSGLTNLIFCAPGTTVIEILSSEYVYPCYWYLANLGNLNYSYLLGEIPEGIALHQLFYPNARLEDIFVNLNALRRILQLSHVIPLS